MSEKRKITVISLLLFIVLFNLQTANTMAIDIYNNNYNGNINPNESIDLNFINFNKKFTLTADVHVNFSIEYFSPLLNRQIALVINNSVPVSLNFSFNLNIEDFLSELPEEPTLEDKILSFRYNSVMKVISNSTIENFKFRFEKNSLLGLYPDQNYTIAYYYSAQDSWELISTIDTYENETSILFLEGSIGPLNGNEEYFFTIYNIKEEPKIPPFKPFFWIWLIILTIAIIIIISLIFVISKGEYIKYIKNRITPIQKGAHRLTLNEVLTNENRNKIIDIILENPGIHFNEILRKIKLSPGNLVWHLDILETYKIIKKERFENYVVYFPYHQKNPISNLDLKLQKSDLTLKVLEMIREEPGIWNSAITKELKTNRKKIEYHIKKLIDLGLIYPKKTGRKKKLFLKSDSVNISDDNNNR